MAPHPRKRVDRLHDLHIEAAYVSEPVYNFGSGCSHRPRECARIQTDALLDVDRYPPAQFSRPPLPPRIECGGERVVFIGRSANRRGAPVTAPYAVAATACGPCLPASLEGRGLSSRNPWLRFTGPSPPRSTLHTTRDR